MAVLIEAISVIVRRGSIDVSFHGGWPQFQSGVPNATLCTDGELVRVGFMSPGETERYVRSLQEAGLAFVRNGAGIDIVVVDQQRGPTLPCEWLEFAQIPFGEDGGRVSVCWLFEGPRVAAGIHVPGGTPNLATPCGWTYEESLSRSFKFLPRRE